MLNFRKMRLEDMPAIYEDERLRSLVTVAPRGEKFAVVINDNNNIIGGVSGYIDGQCALIQQTAILDEPEQAVVKDGLIRSLIHILELDGIKYLLTIENESIYDTIGFKDYNIGNQDFVEPGTQIYSDIVERKSLWISLPDFFR